MRTASLTDLICTTPRSGSTLLAGGLASIPSLPRIVSRAGFVLALILHFAQPVAAAPSFDCAEASTPIEKLICGSQELGHLDSAVAQAYALNRRSLGASDAATLRQQQRSWLARRNAECRVTASGSEPAPESSQKATSCLIELYRRRLAELYRFKLVMSEDDNVCRPLTDLYSELLAKQIEDWVKPGFDDPNPTSPSPLTDFEVTDPAAFVASGFVEPTPTEQGELLGTTSQIYAIDLFGEGRPRIVLLSEYAGRHTYQRYDRITILKRGVGVKEERRLPPPPFGIKATPTGVFAQLDPQMIDRDAQLKLEDLDTVKGPGPPGYPLKKWPNFDVLYEEYYQGRIELGELPALAGWFRQRIFSYKNRIYFVADQYLIADGIYYEGKAYSNATVLIYEMKETGPDDTCYIALFPTPLTASREGRHDD